MRYQLLLLAQLLAACGQHSIEAPPSPSSDLKDVSLNLPAKSSLAKGDLLSGLSLSITPSACAAGVTGTTVAKVLDYGTATLSEKLKKSCDYLVVVEAGEISTDKQSLKTVFFSNKSASAQGTSLPRAELDKAKPALSVKLYITAAGQTVGLGTGAKPADDTDVTLDVQFGGTASLSSSLKPENFGASTLTRCQSGEGKTGYDSGVKSEAGLLDSLWTNNGSQCALAEQFITAVTVKLPDVDASDFQVCRNNGLATVLDKAPAMIRQACAGG